MNSLIATKVWLLENPVAADWWHNDVPEYLNVSLSTDYLLDPQAMRHEVECNYPDWEFKELKDNPDDEFGWYVALHTPYGQVTVFSNHQTFKEMGESLQFFTKLNKHWWGRFWLRFIFWVDGIKSKKN